MNLAPCFQNLHRIPLRSTTRDGSTGQVYTDIGEFVIKEIIVEFEGQYVSASLVQRLVVEFFANRVVDIDPKLKAAYTSTSYHMVQVWLEETRKKMLDRVLKDLPAVRVVLPDGTLEKPTDFEEEMEAYQTFYLMLESESEFGSNGGETGQNSPSN